MPVRNILGNTNADAGAVTNGNANLDQQPDANPDQEPDGDPDANPDANPDPHNNTYAIPDADAIGVANPDPDTLGRDHLRVDLHVQQCWHRRSFQSGPWE